MKIHLIGYLQDVMGFDVYEELEPAETIKKLAEAIEFMALRLTPQKD